LIGAARRYLEASGIPVEFSKGEWSPGQIEINLRFTAATRLEYDHPYLRERGFTDETIKTFGLGYCHRGLMKGRIAIPLHDAKGALIGYAGRIVDEGAIGKDTPRYLFPGSREWNGN
jgi:hypothetical protein